MYLALGFLIGFFGGFVFAVIGATNSERNAVRKGVVKLYGDFYKIERITKENDDEN